MSWELEAKSDIPLRVDVANLKMPEHWTTEREIATQEISIGNQPVELGDCFRIRKSPDGIRRWCGRLENIDGIGALHQSGKMEIRGTAGNRIGDRLRGGELFVHGDAGDDVGRSMTGGHLVVFGNCGNRAGGLIPGTSCGMKGGTLIIQGNCGAQSGERLRRGTLAIGGEAPPDLGHEMIAGTIIAPRLDLSIARFTKRGTLLCESAAVTDSSSFREWSKAESLFPLLLYRNLFKSTPLSQFHFLANSKWLRSIASVNGRHNELFCLHFIKQQ